MTPVAMATNRSYSKTKLAAANIVTSHIIFSLHQLPLPARRYSEFIVIKSNTKNLDKIRLKNSKNQSKKLQKFTKLYKGNMSQHSKTAFT